MQRRSSKSRQTIDDQPRAIGRTMSLRALMVSLCALICSAHPTNAQVQSTPPSVCVTPEKATIEHLFEQRHKAIKDAHPDWLLRLYAPGATLETPFSAVALPMRETQRAFWVDMLARDPRLKIISRSLVATCDQLTDRGTLQLTARVNHRTTEQSTFTLGYELVYERVGAQWLIKSDRSTLQLAANESEPERIGAGTRLPAVAGFVRRAPELAKPATAVRPASVQPSASTTAQPPKAAPVAQKPVRINRNPAPAQQRSVPPVQTPKARPEMPANEVRGIRGRSAMRAATTPQRITLAMELPKPVWAIPTAQR